MLACVVKIITVVPIGDLLARLPLFFNFYCEFPMRIPLCVVFGYIYRVQIGYFGEKNAEIVHKNLSIFVSLEKPKFSCFLVVVRIDGRDWNSLVHLLVSEFENALRVHRVRLSQPNVNEAVRVTTEEKWERFEEVKDLDFVLVSHDFVLGNHALVIPRFDLVIAAASCNQAQIVSISSTD